MNAIVPPRAKSGILWGLVGALAFLVLHQAYLLAGGSTLPVGSILLVTIAVGAISGALSYLAEGRLVERNRRV